MRPSQQSLGMEFERQGWQPAEVAQEHEAGMVQSASRAEAVPVAQPAASAAEVEVAQWWGSKRPYGVRKEDWEDIKRHREASQIATAQFQREAAAGLIKPIEVPVCCTCNFLPYPHLVQSFDEETRYRHSKGGMPR